MNSAAILKFYNQKNKQTNETCFAVCVYKLGMFSLICSFHLLLLVLMYYKITLCRYCLCLLLSILIYQLISIILKFEVIY